jgi:hypothetical protein
MMEEGLTDQKGLPGLEGTAYVRCNTLCRCFRAAHNVSPAGLACPPHSNPPECVVPAVDVLLRLIAMASHRPLQPN